MSVPYSFELSFVMPILKSFDDFYKVCSNHKKHNKYNNNEFPCFRFDWSDALDGLVLPEPSGDLVAKLEERFYDELSTFELENIKEQLGFEVFLDNNGYRMLADIPIKTLWETRSDIEEDCSGDTTDDEYILKEIAGVDNELVEAAKNLIKFLEFKKSYLEYIKGMYNDEYLVIVVDEDGDYDIVEEYQYDGDKEVNGWRRWTPDGVKDEREASRMPGQRKISDY